jgi:4-diphosphocytidyl-2-C-methyl-D-erythritol kinase
MESGDQVTREAPAKLNLRLRVLERDVAGYHAVETLLLQLQLADRVTVRSGKPGIHLEVVGDEGIPSDARNLCWKATDALHRALDVEPAVSIRLEKRIPTAAGLGGGSMDAAATLRALTKLPGLEADSERLISIAGELGSDVPFGLCPLPLALGWERGRRILPLPPPPARPVLIAIPPFGVSAADAYGWLATDRRTGSRGNGGSDPGTGGEVLPPPASLADWEVLSGLAVNDLQPVVFRRHPELQVIRAALSDAGARIAMLCGSGSCVAGIFDTVVDRDRAGEVLEAGAGIQTIRTSTRGPEPG